MPTKEEFKAALGTRFRAAMAAGESAVEINSGDLHRKLGGYPGTSHQMPSCCDAMWEERKAKDQIVESPEKGKGARLTIRYGLPR